MNPPFSNRSKMGEKFPQETQRSLRKRVDDMERILVRNDEGLENFVDKNALEPLFTALADKCVRGANGVLTMINPAVALCAPSALDKRRALAQRYHIHTVLTCHQPGQVNLSQNTNINESVIVMRRHKGPRLPTRFVNLDRLPADDRQANEIHQALLKCQEGQMEDGWGVVSHWPAESIESGDWTPAIWRSPRLAKAGEAFAHDSHPPKPWVNTRLHRSTTGAEGYVRTLRDQIRITKRAYLYWNRKVPKVKRQLNLHLTDIGSLRRDENSRQDIISSGRRTF